MSAHLKEPEPSCHLEERGLSGGPTVPRQASALRLEIGFDSVAQRRIVHEWLGAGLRPDRPGRLQQEYPFLFRRDPSVFHLTLYDGFLPVAFCSLWAVHFRVGVNRLRVGLVSLVYTEPEARGHGFGSRIIEEAIAQASVLKLGLVLLWSDLDALYSPLGFARSGSESLLIVDESIIDDALREATHQADIEADLDIGPPELSDWAAIERFRAQRTCQLELNPGEISMMKSVPDMSVRVARDVNGVQGFAMRGRGDDFAEVIHEWGGRPDAVLHCCRSLVHDCEPESELFLLGPPENTGVPWSLRRAGARVVRKPLAWMRIACTRALSEDLSRILPSESGLRIERLDRDPTGLLSLSLRSSRGVIRLDQASLLDVFLGRVGNPNSGHDKQELRRVLDEATLNTLPLPFFVWGLESI